MRRAARVDVNQKAIVDALKRCGATVWVIGLPVDLLVGHGGKTYLMEVKAGSKKKYTQLQTDFMATWRGVPVSRVETIDQALKIIQE